MDLDIIRGSFENKRDRFYTETGRLETSAVGSCVACPPIF